MKQLVKCKALAHFPPEISSSKAEGWPDYGAIWEKLSNLEWERAQARGPVGSSVVRRSCSEPKAHKLAEL